MQKNAMISQFEDKCRQAGLKITPQRTAVFKELMNTKDHPSADVLFKQVRKTFPHISLDTVNRALLTFSEIGAAFIVEGTGDVRRYDANLEHHQHFKCIKCKRIIDFDDSQFENIRPPDELAGKVKILRKSIYFEGICDKCLKRKENDY